jgi:TonB dependent receptor/Carboxypeptidase regulatory-like domain/TonB-dependent Receptor Plug Domain
LSSLLFETVSHCFSKRNGCRCFPAVNAGGRVIIRLSTILAIPLLLLAGAIPSWATVFSTVHGVVHDPQHRPIVGAHVSLDAAYSAFSLQATTGADGEFEIPQTPIGIYRLTISASGFSTVTQILTVASGTNPMLHVPLPVAASAQTVTVHASGASNASADSVTPTTLITRAEIEQTPGASRTLGMEMITDYVPGAYMSHDMLHMRGGHQTSWLIDGVAIPNTKIASNVGPQIDPKDIDEVETQRGSYAAEVGDRTYGIFNVLPRNGFERNREGEMLLSAGNFYSGESQLSLGNHSANKAWYASLSGSRSNYGLETPVTSVHHDATSSESGFLSLLLNQTPRDQLRINAQLRQDSFQIPYDPDPNDWEQAFDYYKSFGLRDVQKERDGFVLGNWVHTLSPRALFEVAPFYHFNQANYDASTNDKPVATTWHQSSNYVGGQADFHADAGPNNLSAGLYTFYQDERDLFGLLVNDGSANSVPNTKASTSAALFEGYLSDHLRFGRYITLLGGMRFSKYSSSLTESAVYPRIGASIEIPRLHWVLRGFYGHFFQPAPVQTVSRAILNYIHSQSGQNAFIPLPSERNEEHQFGIQIPLKGWLVDVADVRNRVNNFLDHANVGESNMYFPIAVDGALVRAWELSVRSPQLEHLGQFHLAYANQIAEQRGNVIGGFACGDPTDPSCNLGPEYTPVDHDQRHTLNTGFTAKFPSQVWFATNVYYGSGFANGLADANQGPYNGPYLPVHTTLDVSAGHHFGERLELSASVLNLTNHRVLTDNSITIGGFHFNDPRIISVQLRYRFHF